MLKYNFIPYIKAVYDWNIFNNKIFGTRISYYLTYNFPVEYDISELHLAQVKENNLELPNINVPNFKKYSFSSIEAGFTLGFVFGGFNPYKKNTNS